MENPRPTDLILPSGLDWLRPSTIGQSWLNCLPRLVGECADRWGLVVGKAFPYAYTSLVLPATTADGRDVVLKLRYPDDESEHEAEALLAWDGSGAVRLLDQDQDRHAMLLERCRPGRYLSTAGAAAGLDVLIRLLPRLWVSVDNSFTSLSDEAERWVANLPLEFEEAGEPFARSILDTAIDALCELSASQGEQVLLHQDLHGNNVLSAAREDWLAIDPKPLLGEREFGLSPIIRSAEFGHSKGEVLYRLDRLTDELDLDRERARLWTVGQTVAWGFEGGRVLNAHIDVARWLLESG